MGRAGRIAAWSAGGVATLVIAGFALLQSGPAKDWLAAEIGAVGSSPTMAIKVDALSGLVPFDMHVGQISLGDSGGAWLTVDNARLAWSPSALLRGRLRIDHLTAEKIEVLRQPAPSGQSSSSPLTLPRLPVSVDLRELNIARFILSPQVAGGDNAEASVAAHGLLAQDHADIAIDLTRTDAQPGTGTLDVRYDQAADRLAVKLDLDEPTGVLLDAAMARTDHLPLRATLDGSGPLSGWQGQFRLTAGPDVHSDARIDIAHTVGTKVGIAGDAAIAPLLKDDLRPLVGDDVKFSVVASEDGKGGMTLASSQVTLASVILTGQGSRTANGKLDGRAHIAVPDVSRAESLVASPTAGQIDIDMTFAGTIDRPKLTLAQHGRLSFGDIAVDDLAINADVNGKPGATNDDPLFDLTVDAKAGSVRGLSVAQDYGPLTIHLAGTTDVKGALVDVSQLSVNGGGVAFEGKGGFKDGIADGKATLAAADLSILGRIFGLETAGSANLDLTVKTARDRTATLSITGKGSRVRTGIPAADALVGDGLTLDVGGTRTMAGKVALDRFALATPRAKIEASGSFDQVDKSVAGTMTATLADLQALAVSKGPALGGSGKLSATVGGTLDAPALDADVVLDRLNFGAARIDRLDLKMLAPRGLNGGATIAGRVASGKLAETIDGAVSREAGGAYRLDKLKMAGTGGTVDAALTFDPAGRKIAGKLNASMTDLSVWSGVAAQKLAGKMSLAVDLPADGRRQGPVKARIDGFVLGTSPDTVGITHAEFDGRLSGDLSRQNGTLDVKLNGLAAQGAAVTDAALHIAAAGRKTDFKLSAAGRAHDPVSLTLAGSAEEGAKDNTLRLATLTAKLGHDTLTLSKPATIVVAPGSYRLSGLSLMVDGGALEGDAALSPRAVSANLHLKQLPLHPLALLAGRPFVAGTLDGGLTLAGSPQKPEAHLSLTTQGLDVQTDGPLPRPKLNVTASADWHGERVNVDAKVATGSGEALTLDGSVPFAFDLVALQPRAARDPKLALAVKGSGRLENLLSIVPFGEDRIAGAFTLDVAVAGTLTAPRPSGRIAITGGSYTNQALGTEIDNLDLAVDGAGDRFVLDHVTATDGKAGKVSASGSVDFTHAPATVGLDLGFDDFLVARGDDVTIDADGKLKLAGTLKALAVSGKISVRNADLYIPDRLPASIVTLDVTEVGGRQVEETPKSRPVAPVQLQIGLDAPGQVFVRGHGLTSEWRGNVNIAGTTSAPVMTGQLSVLNGNLNLLGQTFNLDQGIVGFDGGASINPALNVQASASASSITANVSVTGTARAPKIALTSTPVLPQDEILARVLFGSSVGSLTPSQGLQLAAAAATLAQGGPGILDRVRSTIGLDRLDLGAGGGNPNGTQGAAKGTTVSGGKYIANGVFVGVAQGLTDNSSQAKVEVEVTPNISVNSTFGTASGSGFGAKYSFDY